MAVTVTYNGTSLPNVFGPFSFKNDYLKASFSCNFYVEAASESALVTSCNNIEDKLREPLEDLSVVFGGTTEYSFSHDSNTVLNPFVSAEIFQGGPLLLAVYST